VNYLGIPDNFEAIQLANSVQQLFPHQVDSAANPSVGQAFLIVERNWVSNAMHGGGQVNPDDPASGPGGPLGFPYHAAAVVAEDGADKVTLEGMAGSSDAQDTDPRQPGMFDMYAVNGGTSSFHGRHGGSFSNPITIVIKP